MNVKKWYKSKTIWVNVLAVSIALITYIEGVDFLPEHVATALVSIVLPVANIALRFLTDKPILKSVNDPGKPHSCSVHPFKCSGCPSCERREN